MPADKLILGLDPGRDKTGVALADTSGRLLQVQVVPTEQIPTVLPKLAARAQVLVIGDGTTSAKMQQLVRQLAPNKPLVVINETSSTEAARPLYWQEHPPTGWRKLVPLGMLVPPEPLDGYAAAILVRRYLQQESTTQEKS